MKYYLNPDFRKQPPKDCPFCVRCQRPLKGASIAVTVDWATLSVTKGGKELMGTDCWKKVQKDPI